MTHFKVQSKKAPAPMNYRGRGSAWRDLFESMKPGQWFTLSEDDRCKTNAAAVKHLRGRYTLYRIEENTYCFVKLR